MTTSGACNLCGSSLGRSPAARQFAGEEKTFCCHGCLHVYAILFESGLAQEGRDFRETDLFRQSLRLGLISRRDDAAVPAVDAVPEDAEVKETLFQLSGMWCTSCGWIIERVLRTESAVRSAEVFFASDLLRVSYCPQYLAPGTIERRVAGLGYACSEYAPGRSAESAERRDVLLRIGVAAFVWMNVMYLSMVHYVGYFEQVTESARRVVPLILMALSAPAVFYSAFPILRLAWLGLRERVIRVETLLALGILSAFGYSSVEALAGGRHFYFDTACAIVTLVLAGKLIEKGARERTVRAMSSLYRMLPRKARVVEDGRERFLSVEALAPGVLFLIKPGEVVPADGVVVEGRSHLDESVLTGEAAPAAKEPGAIVVCGSTNGPGVLKARATRTGSETTLSQVVRMVEKALSTRSGLERQADRISRVFVPAVIGIALATFAGALFFQAAGPALMRAITVLVVACPCALGIATPLAVTAAVGRASRRGMLITDSHVLETVNRLDVMIFDKTGTITEGRFRLVDHAQAGGGRDERRFEAEHLPLVASLENCSEHPLGRAVVECAAERRVALELPRQAVAREGAGIAGHVGRSAVFVGSANLPEVRAAGVPGPLAGLAGSWAEEGRTVAYYGWDGAVRGALAFGDRLRPESAEVLSGLRRSGIRTWVVSGDSESATRHVARAVGADEYRAGCMPGDKGLVIRELQKQGRIVAMVGDGVNDAPALAQADLGIAMGSGTDIAMRAAPVTLMTSNLRRIPEILALARKTVRIVRQNLFWAFFYNTGGIALAISGVLNPIVAAAAMVVSSLSVILNSSRGGTIISVPNERQATIRRGRTHAHEN